MKKYSFEKILDKKSASWILLNQGVLKIIVAMKFLILAKILGVGLIGDLSLILLIIALSEALTDFGFNFSITSKIKTPNKNQINSLWTISILRGMLAAIIIIIFSTIMLNILDKEDLLLVSYISSLIPFIRSFNSTYNFLSFRNQDYKKIFIWNFVYVFCDIFISISVAYFYKDMLLIVLGLCLSEIIKVIFSFIIFKGTLKIRFYFTDIKEELNYGKWIWKSSVLTYFINQLDKFIVPIILGVSTFGGYQTVNKAAQFGLSDLAQVSSSILFPKFSEKNRVNENPKLLLKKSCLVMVALLVMITTILIKNKEFIITYSVGKEFLEFSNLYIVFCLQMCLGVIISILVSYLRAINKPDVVTKAIYIQFFVILICMSICYFLKLNYYFISASNVIALLVTNIILFKNIYSREKKVKNEENIAL